MTDAQLDAVGRQQAERVRRRQHRALQGWVSWCGDQSWVAAG
jgi:hypothetical protein